MIPWRVKRSDIWQLPHSNFELWCESKELLAKLSQAAFLFSVHLKEVEVNLILMLQYSNYFDLKSNRSIQVPFQIVKTAEHKISLLSRTVNIFTYLVTCLVLVNTIVQCHQLFPYFWGVDVLYFQDFCYMVFQEESFLKLMLVQQKILQWFWDFEQEEAFQ